MEKRSRTWKYFSICEADECKTIISRGGSNMCVLFNSFVSKLFEFEPYSAKY